MDHPIQNDDGVEFCDGRPPRKETFKKPRMNKKPKRSSADNAALLEVLQRRFEKHMHRHSEVEWATVRARLDANTEKLQALHEMEDSGGEPDVTSYDQETGEIVFFDCSTETPKGRTSHCYDREGLDSRKEYKPANTVMDLAAAMGIEVLTEDEYMELQTLGDFDLKTSSWLKTPAAIRKLGGALYGDRRYGRVFVGHNGAQSYYGARAFRGMLRV